MFSTELVTVAFQRGAFDAAATATTSQVFVGYCLGMLFLGVTTVVTNVFYGYGDTKITMDKNVLTLITCTPVYVASHRLIVTAELTGSEVKES